jgi:hypothetical protein
MGLVLRELVMDRALEEMRCVSFFFPARSSFTPAPAHRRPPPLSPSATGIHSSTGPRAGPYSVGFLDREFSVGLKGRNTAWTGNMTSSVGMFVLCFVGPMPNPQGARLLGLGPNVFSDDVSRRELPVRGHGLPWRTAVRKADSLTPIYDQILFSQKKL